MSCQSAALQLLIRRTKKKSLQWKHWWLFLHDNVVSKPRRPPNVTKSKCRGASRCNPCAAFNLSAASYKNAIHHWCSNHWCSTVCGPLCTLIIHHQFLPVSAPAPYTCNFNKWAPRTDTVCFTNICRFTPPPGVPSHQVVRNQRPAVSSQLRWTWMQISRMHWT